ncbi:MAG: hypothetical protein HUU57_13860 [Bdellovibrio sp.]|nr:hypothetical protein [Bdellovibrio sp.]
MKKKKEGSVLIPSSGIYNTTIYTGNGGTQSITTLADLDTAGGLVWIKRRDSAASHALFDTARGAENMLSSDTAAASVGTQPFAVTSTGFTITSSGTTNYNANGATYVAWSFKRQPKFFDLSAVTKSAGSDAVVNFPDLAELGMVMVKRTDSTGDWYMWHRGLNPGNLFTHTNGTETAMNHFTVSGTTIILNNGTIENGTYIVYAWAHDSSTTGNIYFGSVANGHGATTFTIGWEPQALYYKGNGFANWTYFDTVRGDTNTTQKVLVLTYASAEASYSNQPYPLSTGISWPGGVGPVKLLYMAIRKP